MRKERQYLRNKKEENIMKSKKKKGFTLVELIAVIAILGILAAVIVPRVTGYSDRARASKEKANAASIINAIEIYNAEASTSKRITFDATTLATIAGATGTTTYDTGLGSFDDLKDTINKVTVSGSEIKTSTKLSSLPTIRDAATLDAVKTAAAL
jgi:type IV pilus assembly protein PilA